MNAEQAKKLRAPFPPAQIGKLPKAGILLDYVGHASVTDRLLQVDPAWTWEPLACGPNGEPLVVNGGLWIKLTVCGVTRPGWGDGKNVKEMIGDAIRNAAMRFGVALDLWAREDLHASGEESASSDGKRPAAAGTGTVPAGRSQFRSPADVPEALDEPVPDDNNSPEARTKLFALLGDLDKAKPLPDATWGEAMRHHILETYRADSTKQLTLAEMRAVYKHFAGFRTDGVAVA